MFGCAGEPGPRRSAYYGTPGTISWNRGEGWISDITVDPAKSNIVYSAADAVRKSTDGGHTWKTVFQPPAPPWGRAFVERLVIATTRPQTIYAMVNGYGPTSIYKSTDAGAGWHATGGRGGAFAYDYGQPTAIAVDPHQPTTVYAAIDHTVVKTTDAGASWQPIMHSQPEQSIHSLAIDPQQIDTVYAGVYTGASGRGAIYQTTDGGRTWRLAVSTVAINAIAVNPSRPTTIYAAGWGGRDAT